MGFSIRPCAPYRLDLTTWALRRRKSNIIDSFDGTWYHRVLLVDSHEVLVSIRQRGAIDKPVLEVVAEGSGDISKYLASIKQMVQRLLGTDIDISQFYDLAEKDRFLGGLVKYRGFRPPRFASVYEAMFNAICFQQLSLHVGVVLMNRLALTFGRQVETEFGRFYSLPEPEALVGASRKRLLELGLSNNKAMALMELARRAEELEAIEKAGDEEAIERLETFRGIGRWSAEYVLLRGLGRLHVFPGDDVGFQNSLKRLMKLSGRPRVAETRGIVEKWFPYGGLVYFHMLLARLDAEGLLEQ